MKLQRARKLKNILIYLLIIVFTLEISPFLLGSFLLENGFSRKSIRENLERRARIKEDSSKTASTDPEGYLSQHMVHPYLGFVHKPGGNYNPYGFLLSKPVPQKSKDTLNVCVTGGSVAKQMIQFSEETLVRELQKIPRFNGKEINLVVFALGGFKQPQQLIALTYYSSLGAYFDIVINLDGFNEVVLPYADNLPFGIHPSFPRHWNVYSKKTLDKESTVYLGRQEILREKQITRARRMIATPLKISNFALFLWKILDQETDLTIHQIETELRTHLANSDKDPQTTGPPFNTTDTLNFLKQQVDTWASSSRIIHELCVTRGMQYFHFLQPNQYVDGSKILTEEEKMVAFQKGKFSYKTAVRQAYPLLILKGQNLAMEGLNYTDLTQLFSKTKQTIYTDKCCHFNKTGYDVIVQEIISVIRHSQPVQASLVDH